MEACDRAHWAELTGFDPKLCVIVHFPTSAQQCRDRIVARGDHPTLAHVDAAKAQAVINSFAKRQQVPTLSAERKHFSACWVIDSPAEMRRRLVELGCDSEVVDQKLNELNSGHQAAASDLAASVDVGDEKDAVQPSSVDDGWEVAAGKHSKVSTQKPALLASASKPASSASASPAQSKSRPVVQPPVRVAKPSPPAHNSEENKNGSDGHDHDGDQFIKFPRTHHLLDTGGSAVSRDDLLGKRFSC